jgi:hypothetical protein
VTWTYTITNTPTVTYTNTVTKTPTVTFTNTISPTFTNTATNTKTPTITLTATNTATQTITLTPTNTGTSTMTYTVTSTPTTCTQYGQPGQQGYSGSTSANYSADQFSVGQATTVDSLSVYCYCNNASLAPVYLALYNTSTGNLVTWGTAQFKSSYGATYETASVTPVGIAAGTYNLVAIMPSGTSTYLGISSNQTNWDYGTYTGGNPPANYSTLSAGSQFGSFSAGYGYTIYFTGCP